MGSFRRKRSRPSRTAPFRHPGQAAQLRRTGISRSRRREIPAHARGAAGMTGGPRSTGSFRRIPLIRLHHPRFMGSFRRKRSRPSRTAPSRHPGQAAQSRRSGISRSRRHEIPAHACGAAGITGGSRCMGSFRRISAKHLGRSFAWARFPQKGPPRRAALSVICHLASDTWPLHGLVCLKTAPRRAASSAIWPVHRLVSPEKGIGRCAPVF